jgi:hypothetical protein
VVRGGSNFTGEAKPLSVRTPGHHSSRGSNKVPKLNRVENPFGTADGWYEHQHVVTFGVRLAADESNLLAVRRPGGIRVFGGGPSEAQRMLLAEECDVDVALAIFTVPGKGALAAIRRHRGLALIAGIAGHGRNARHAYHGFACDDYWDPVGISLAGEHHSNMLKTARLWRK